MITLLFIAPESLTEHEDSTDFNLSVCVFVCILSVCLQKDCNAYYFERIKRILVKFGTVAGRQVR